MNELKQAFFFAITQHQEVMSPALLLESALNWNFGWTSFVVFWKWHL